MNFERHLKRIQQAWADIESLKDDLEQARQRRRESVQRCQEALHELLEAGCPEEEHRARQRLARIGNAWTGLREAIDHGDLEVTQIREELKAAEAALGRAVSDSNQLELDV